MIRCAVHGLYLIVRRYTVADSDYNQQPINV